MKKEKFQILLDKINNLSEEIKKCTGSSYILIDNDNYDNFVKHIKKSSEYFL